MKAERKALTYTVAIEMNPAEASDLLKALSRVEGMLGVEKMEYGPLADLAFAVAGVLKSA